jgi:ATP synthase protein I
MTIQRIGGYAFLLGLLLSIIFALIPSINTSNWVPIVLLVLGIIIGLLNIEDKNITLFLLASIVLIATSATPLNTLPIVGSFLQKLILNFVNFVMPAALIVSVVAIIRIANSK